MGNEEEEEQQEEEEDQEEQEEQDEDEEEEEQQRIIEVSGVCVLDDGSTEVFDLDSDATASIAGSPRDVAAKDSGESVDAKVGDEVLSYSEGEEVALEDVWDMDWANVTAFSTAMPSPRKPASHHGTQLPKLAPSVSTNDLAPRGGGRPFATPPTLEPASQMNTQAPEPPSLSGRLAPRSDAGPPPTRLMPSLRRTA